MKNQIALGILIACSLHIASGQISSPINKHSFLLGGSIIANYENETRKFPNESYYHKDFTIGTDAYCGYFISNHISVGLLTDFSIKNSKNSISFSDLESIEISNNYSFGPFLRFYFKPGIFLEEAFTFGFKHFGQNDSPEKARNYSISSGIGYSLFITNSLALEPIIKYRYEKTYWDSEYDVKVSNNGIFFSLGLQYYISKIQ